MNHRNTQKSKYSWILNTLYYSGSCIPLYIWYLNAIRLKNPQNHIENIVDYDAVLRANAFEKRQSTRGF